MALTICPLFCVCCWQVEKWAKSYSFFLWYVMFHTIKKQPLSSWSIGVLLKAVCKLYTKRSLADRPKKQMFQQLCKKYICLSRCSLTKWSYGMCIEIFFLPNALFGFLHRCKTCRMKHASSFLTLLFISASRSAVPDWKHLELPVSSQCLQWPVWFGYGQVG